MERRFFREQKKNDPFLDNLLSEIDGLHEKFTELRSR
jgi:hypothetical protein